MAKVSSGGERRRNQVALAVLDWLYPRVCVACGADVGPGGALCVSCWSQTPFIGRAACRRCGAPLGAETPVDAASETSDAAVPCDACRRAPAPWRTARAATLYAGAARELALALKHRDLAPAAQLFGGWMASAGADVLKQAPDERRPPLLTPVPMHWRRRFSRRFNQAAELARAVSDASGAPLLEDGLRRARRTRALEGLGRDARQAAVDDVFRPARGVAARIAGRRLILVDDVLTTGATAAAATRALLNAGAASVDLLVACRVAPDPFAPPSTPKDD